MSAWILIGATFLLAGVVKGVIGMGLPTVAMGVLAVVLPPAEAAALVIPSLVTNVWQLFAGPSFGALARRLWLMMAGVFVGTVAGIGVLAGDDPGWRASRLGVMLAIYAVVGLAGLRIPKPGRREVWLGTVDRRHDRRGDRGNRHVHHPGGALSAGDRPGAGRPDPGARPLLHGVDDRAGDRAVAGRCLALGSVWASLLALVPALIGMQAGAMAAPAHRGSDVSQGVLRGPAVARGIYLVVERLA